MSVASRIEAIETHIGDIYDSLELGGADLTNVNKNIVNINTQLIDRYKDYLANGIDIIWTNWEKVLAEGTDLTLNNTIKARLQLDLKGNTSQIATTTGKNKLPTIKASDTINQVVFTKNSDGSITANGTASARTDLYLVGTSASDYGDLKLPAGTYTLSGCPATGSSSTYMFICVVKHSNDTTSTYVDYGTDNVNINVASGDTFRIFMRIANGVQINNLTFYPQLESGNTKTTYEPFIPNSPSPDYPQDIHVVSGDNTIKVDGKNLLPNTATTDTINQLAFTINDDKSISISGTPNATTTFSINTTNITLPAGTYTMSTHKEGTFSGNAYINVRLADESANITTINLRLSSSATFTLEQETTLYVRIYSSSGITFTGVKIYPMIEKGETASTYTPYQTPQTQLISLGSLWLGKISTYQDYFYKNSGKWYLHKEIGKVVLNGSEENWSLTTGTNKYSFWFRNNTIGALTQIHKKYCNLFTYTSNAYTVAGTPYLCENNATDNPSNFMFIFNTDGTQGTTIPNWKSWLSSNNVIAYFILNEATNTEITDTTLLEQLNNLEQIKSKKNQTNINQENNDLPFIITASALKEYE